MELNWILKIRNCELGILSKKVKVVLKGDKIWVFFGFFAGKIPILFVL